MEDRYLFKAKRVYNGGEWVQGYYVKGLDMYDKEVHLIFEPNTMFYSSGETADKQIDVAVTLRARDYKGLDNYGSNGVIEWKN